MLLKKKWQGVTNGTKSASSVVSTYAFQMSCIETSTNDNFDIMLFYNKYKVGNCLKDDFFILQINE